MQAAVVADLMPTSTQQAATVVAVRVQKMRLALEHQELQTQAVAQAVAVFQAVLEQMVVTVVLAL
jgi:hypothetical protein